MTAAERISSLVILPSLVLIGWAKLPSSMEVPSNNPSFCFPIPLSGCGITLWGGVGVQQQAGTFPAGVREKTGLPALVFYLLMRLGES